MGIIAKYKFNQNTYANFIPEFNSEFTDYTYTDEIDTDGYTIRTIESDSLPTLIRFGYISGGITTTQAKSLLSVEYINTSNVTDMSSMFRNCTSLTSLDVSNFDTGKVTDMNCMFHSCSALTSLDVSSFNTSSVTNMGDMFRACTSLTSLDLTNFNTSKVTDMSNMFNTCKLLTSLDLSNFNTSQVTNVNSMFSGCSALISLNLSNFNTSEVTSMDSMFYGCSKLTSLNLSNFNTSKVTTMSNMFYNCYALTSLNVSNFNTGEVTTVASMFYNCSKLKVLDLSNFNTSQVTSMSSMFSGCSALTSLNVSSFNTGEVTSMGSMFYGCSALTSLGLSNFNTSKVTSMSSMFHSCKLLTSLNVSSFNTSKVTAMSSIFYGCSALTSLDLSNWDTSKVTNKGTMFKDWSSSQKVYISSKWTLGTDFPPTFIATFANTIAKYKFNQNTYADFIPEFNSEFTDYVCSDEIDTDGYTIRTIGSDSDDLPTLIRFGNTDSSGNGDYTKQHSLLEVNEINTSNVTDMSLMFYQCKNLTYINTNFNTSKVNNMSYMFSSCSALTSLDVSNFNTGLVTNMRDTFSGCSALTSLDVSSFNTSLVTNMGGMFYSCSKLTSLDLSNFDTSQVTIMYYMFNSCSKLTSLDLSSFNTSLVTNVSNMFYNCVSLASLDVSNFNTSSVIDMTNMFSGCTSLTSIDLSSFNTSKVTSMQNMFQGCNALTSLDVSNFDTSSVINMMSMFNRCSSLTSLDLSSFNTSKVDNMAYMFLTCTSLTSLNISNFNTEKVTSMVIMFQNCTSLKVLDLTSFNTKSVTSSDDMFINLTSDQIVYTNANLWTLDTSTYDATFVSLAGRLIASYKYNTNLYSDLIPTFTGLTSSQYTINDLDTNPTTEVDTSTWVLGSLNAETGAEIASSSTYRSDYIEVLPSVGYIQSSVGHTYFYDSTKNFIERQASLKPNAPTNAKYVRVVMDSRPTTFTLTTRHIKTRAIASDVLPTLIRFGESDTSINTPTNMTSSLLEVLSVNTTNVSLMSYMFKLCNNLSYVAATFDTSKVTNMTYMFTNCESLTHLDLSSFDVSKITLMSQMFQDCKNLVTLNLSTWDTKSVTAMNSMFYNCSSLTSLDLSNFNTREATNMSYMFSNCSKLISLDLSSFNTSKATAMNSMFSNCSSLTSLDLSNFDTSKVENMSNMFQNCSSLTSLNLSNFNTETLTNMNQMFYNCTNLTSLNISSFNTGKAVHMVAIFQNCSSLSSLDLSGFNTSSARYMNQMFQGCSSLTSLNVSNFDTSSVTDMPAMFLNCSKLTSLDLSNFDTSSVTDMDNMFHNCSALTSLDLSNFNINLVTDTNRMFRNCTSLVLLDLSNFDTSSVTDMNEMFHNCPLLTQIGTIYCNSDTVNSLSTALGATTTRNIYYHDANLSDLAVQDNITYQYYGKSTVTLPYELNKLPNGVADYIDVVNGVYVQRVGKFIANGTESWYIGTYANVSINDQCTIFTTHIKDKTGKYNDARLCDKWTLYNTDVIKIANIEGIHGGGNDDSFFINVSNSKATTVEQWKAYLQSNPFTYMYELKEPIYTPLTDEEKASLPLSAYSNGYIQLSSDELRPSKFEFRAKSSNRMQLDMLETGHYYLNALTGNIKLGNVDIDVTEMPCIINVTDRTNNRLVDDSLFYKDVSLDYEEGYLNIYNGQPVKENTRGRWVSNFIELPYNNKAIYFVNDCSLIDICYYDENGNFVTGAGLGNVQCGKEFILIGNTNVKYMRFSGVNSEMTIQLREYLITLSKLPSHRIPTTFTQGMKSSVNFGYWEGSKESLPVNIYTTDLVNWQPQYVININNGGMDIALNRIATPDQSRIVEDELDISTGKYIKRIGKMVLNGKDEIVKGQKWTNNPDLNSEKTMFFYLPNNRFTGSRMKTLGLVLNDIFLSTTMENRIFMVQSKLECMIGGDASNGMFQIMINKNRLNGLTSIDFHNWIKENPITVYYELETPEITYLDLSHNVLPSYDNATNVQSYTPDNSIYLLPQIKSSPLSYPTTLSPNTQYTVFHNRKNYNGSVKTPMINLGGTEVVATGSRTVVTTPSTLTHNELQFIGGENTVEQVMVLHGDWTKEGKTVDYFEGLQSSIIGDKTLENLVDEPTNIWTSGVTGGAVDYVSMDDIVVGYANKAKLPEVQVGTDVRSYGITLQNLASLSNITKITGELTAGQSKVGCFYNLKNNMLKIGGQYTVICEIKVNSNTNTYIYNELFGRNSSDGGLSHGLSLCKANEIGTFRKVGYISSFHPEALTTDGMVGYVACRTEDRTQPASYDIELLSIIILEGDYTNMHIPYFEGMKSVENPVYHSVGKNLLNEKTITVGYISSTGEELFDRANAKYEYTIISPNTTYYGYNFGYTKAIQVSWYDVNKTFLNRVTCSNDSSVISPSNAYYARVHGQFFEYNSEESNNDFSTVQIMLSTEPITSYEPYKENILSTPQGTVLRGVGSYKDVIGWNDGIIRRNCVEFTITGEEGYSITSITENTNTIACGISWRHLGLANKILGYDGINMVICDKLPSTIGSEDTPHIRQSSGQPYSDTLMFWFDKTKFSTYTSQGINDYIKSIGGLTIVAPLADTQYEDVEFTGGGNYTKRNMSDVSRSNMKYSEYQPKDTSLARFDIYGLNIVTTSTNKMTTNSKDFPYRFVHGGDFTAASEVNIECVSNHSIDSSMMNIFIKKERLETIDVEGLQKYLRENPLIVWYQTTSNTINNTNPLIFNHGTVYTTTDTHPSTFLDFTLKTTNRYAVKDFNTLKYTVLTKQPFYLNGIDYPASSTGMTIIDVTSVIDTSIYSDDHMITVVQEDGNYYTDGVLQQFKGEQTFTKEFIRTSNGTYNTGMTLLEPLELNSLPNGVKDEYNPITGEIIRKVGYVEFNGDDTIGWESPVAPTVGAVNMYSTWTSLPLDNVKPAPGSPQRIGGLCDPLPFFNGALEGYDFEFYFISTTGRFNMNVSRSKLAEKSVQALKDYLSQNPIKLYYELQTPQIIQATPTSTYISTRPENGNIIAQDTQIQAEYLNYDNEQSIISPRMLGEGDTIRWEQGSQCYVYENDNEYIPLTEHDELFGANIQAQEYTQYVESVEGAKVELGIALKEKAVYEQTYVKYEDNIVYPTTMENIDETNGVEVEYICGATWQNPDDLSDIRHLGTLREDGQYDVTIRRSGDDEIRLLEGTTHIGLDYDELPPSEFELTFFNNGGVEVGKYGDTTHVLEDCVENSKLASGTVYGQTLVNLVKTVENNGKINGQYAGVVTLDRDIIKPSTTYTWFIYNDSSAEVSLYVQHWFDYKTFTIPANSLYKLVRVTSDTAPTNMRPTCLSVHELMTVEQNLRVMLVEGDYTNVDIPYFEGGMKSTIVNGFSSCGKNFICNDLINPFHNDMMDVEIDRKTGWIEASLKEPTTHFFYTLDLTKLPKMKYKLIYEFADNAKVYKGIELRRADGTGNDYGFESFDNTDGKFNQIRLYLQTTTNAPTMYTKFRVMLVNDGLVNTTYEPYKETTYTLPTPITLRKVGDACDTFDVVGGKLTQRIGEVVLDGSEYWIVTTATDSQGFLSLQINMQSEIYWVSGMKMDSMLKNDKVPITSFNQSSSIGMFFDGWGLYLRLPVSTREDFIAYLKSNPITVQYRRLTESVKTINLIPSTTQTTQEPTFILPQPLRSVPNGICDRLYWDENKGHYCIEKRIETEILDGSTKIGGKYNGSEPFGDITAYFMKKDTMFKTGTADNLWVGYSQYFKNLNSGLLSKKTEEGVFFRNDLGNIYFKIKLDKLTEDTTIGFSQWLEENKPKIMYAHTTPEIIDLPHLDKKVELPTQPDIYPIGYKVVHEKVNPQLGLTIPYKVLNMPTQPTNLNFVMDIADYVLTWDDVKEARQYNVILNDNVIATVKEPHWNSGEEMYGYVLVEAQNEIGDSLSKELYIKTVPNAPAQLTVAHNPQTDFYDFEISFIDTSEIAEYFTVMYRVDNGEWVVEDIPAEDLELNTKVLIRFSIYEIKECIEVWATATNDVGTNDILPSAIYYMSPTPQWTYRINGKEAFLRWLDESPYDVQYKLRYSYKSNGAYQYAYFEGDASEIGKLYEAVLPLAEDDEVTVALCIISEKENLYSKPVTVSKALDPNIVPPLNFNYHWLARGLIEFYWEDQYNVDVEYEYILESMKSGEVLWQTITEVIPSRDVTGTGEVYKVEHQLEDLEQIRMKVRMKWAMNETEWSETLTTVFIPVEGNPPTYIRRTQTAEGLLIEWEAQSYIDGYHIYVIDNKTGEELQHIETLDNSILVDIDYSKSIEIAIYEISRFSGGIEADATDPMVFTPTMLTTDIEQRIYQPTMEEYLIETSTVQKGTKEAYIIHDSTYTPNVETEEVLGVGISTPFIISYHPMVVDVHQAGSRIENTINAHIKTLDTRTEELVNVMTFERTTATYDLDFRVYTPSTASYPINVDISKVRIVCLGDSLTSGHPFYWE